MVWSRYSLEKRYAASAFQPLEAEDVSRMRVVGGPGAILGFAEEGYDAFFTK